MKVYTISSGTITEGVSVNTLELSNGVKIPVVQVGESGRGRHLASIAVQLTPETHKKWLAGESVSINNVVLGKTKTDKPKLIEVKEESEYSEFLAVFRTKIGFRGGNSHTGDRIDMANADSGFHPFPGRVIAKGVIAQGDAGGMGSGEQPIAVIPTNTVFRTAYSGRLYGSPGAHYYFHDGAQLFGLTFEERELSGLF